MPQGVIKRVCILVKAYPHFSQKYEETVCCAGVTEDGELVRIYPINYRRLRPDQQFQRFDLLQVRLSKAPGDYRPESYQVSPESIQILSKGSALSPLEKVNMWLPFISPSLFQLREKNAETERSLGIIKPQADSIRFTAVPLSQNSEQDQSFAKMVYRQASLFSQEDLPRLETPDYVFSYRFLSDGHEHVMKIHDWEIQAAYFKFKRKYGDEALSRLTHVYGENLPIQNLHIILGTMLSHPRQFIIIGLLRTSIDVAKAGKQESLF